MINSIKNIIGERSIGIKINVNKCINTLKRKFKKKDEYEWVYECSLDSRYEGNVCIAEDRKSVV